MYLIRLLQWKLDLNNWCYCGCSNIYNIHVYILTPLKKIINGQRIAAEFNKNRLQSLWK